MYSHDRQPNVPLNRFTNPSQSRVLQTESISLLLITNSVICQNHNVLLKDEKINISKMIFNLLLVSQLWPKSLQWNLFFGEAKCRKCYAKSPLNKQIKVKTLNMDLTWNFFFSDTILVLLSSMLSVYKIEVKVYSSRPTETTTVNMVILAYTYHMHRHI